MNTVQSTGGHGGAVKKVHKNDWITKVRLLALSNDPMTFAWSDSGSRPITNVVVCRHSARGPPAAPRTPPPAGEACLFRNTKRKPFKTS
ncbi:hypothetical protein EVAR_10027_1 [Eumeta japonica]|uniref:Uncharacterized protein n=1 Tax=Eumeta variegata TaxID=151549 RepID=A0A4C1TR39_EUMVA|nr:hypothetical protein EVAR_10027_1 [Eumeta japonica]